MSNKDYIGFFHKLHCILRDGEIGITGLTALNEINNMVFIIFIEQYSKKYELSDTEKFSYMYSKYIIPYLKTNINTEKNTIIDNFIGTYEDILMSLYNNPNTKKYIFSDTNKLSAFSSISKNHDVDNNTYNGALQQLISLFQECKLFFYGEDTIITEKLIHDTFDQINFDLLGDSYEKFKEDEVGNLGKTTGQYFSPRCAIKFIIDDLLKPSYKDKTYDSSCGSGGFIHFLNKHVLSHSTKKQHGQFKLNIYANDKTPEIMKPLYINMFLHDIPVDNICNKNSLSSSNCIEKLESMDCIPGNPPYGMSIKANPQNYIMTINDKSYNYWPSFMIQSKLNLVKDSTSQFIIHTINSLKVNGRFALIIDRGIINNGNENNSFQKKLRQWILTVCDLQSIILLPKGIFATTQFDTAIIYGIKKIGLIDSYNSAYKPSTPKVKYYIGNFEDSKNKTGLKVDLDNPDIELDIKDIVNKDWSLKYDDYVGKIDESYNGIEYKSLGEVCEYNIGGTPSTKDSKFWNGNNIWVSISDLNENIINDTERKITDLGISESSVKLIPKNTLLYSFKLTVGKTSITGQPMYCNEAIAFFTDLKNISKEYLRIYLKLLNFNKIKHLSNSQIGNSLNKSTLGKIKIPILPPEHQQQIVDIMDTHIGSDYNILDRLSQEFNTIDLFKFLLYERYDTFEVIIKLGKDLIDYDKYGKTRFNTRRSWLFEMVKGKEMKLGELVEYEYGTRVTNTKDGIKTGYNGTKYNVYGGGGATFQVNKFNRNKGTLIMSRFGVSPNCIRIVDEDFFLNDSGMSLKYKNNINKEFMNNYLLNNQNRIFKYAEGQGQKNMQTVKLFRELSVFVPSPEDQEKVVAMIQSINDEESEFNNCIKSLKSTITNLYYCVEQYTKGEAVVNNTDGDNDDEQEEENDDEQEEDNDDEENDEEDTDDEKEELKHVEIKGKTYLSDGCNIYRINKDDTKGDLYGSIVDGKFKKHKL